MEFQEWMLRAFLCSPAGAVVTTVPIGMCCENAESIAFSRMGESFSSDIRFSFPTNVWEDCVAVSVAAYFERGLAHVSLGEVRVCTNGLYDSSCKRPLCM